MTIDWYEIFQNIKNCKCPSEELDNACHGDNGNDCDDCWGQYIEKLVLEEHNRNKPDLTWLGIDGKRFGPIKFTGYTLDEEGVKNDHRLV